MWQTTILSFSLSCHDILPGKTFVTKPVKTSLDKKSENHHSQSKDVQCKKGGKKEQEQQQQNIRSALLLSSIKLNFLFIFTCFTQTLGEFPSHSFPLQTSYIVKRKAVTFKKQTSHVKASRQRIKAFQKKMEKKFYFFCACMMNTCHIIQSFSSTGSKKKNCKLELFLCFQKKYSVI